jgi:hypothetical protein
MSLIDKETAQAAGNLVAAITVAAGAPVVSPVVGVLVPLALQLADRLCDAGYAVPDVDTLRAKAQTMASLPDLETKN